MNKIFKGSLIIASLFATGFLTGCEKEDDAPEIKKTAVAEMAGEWWVKFEVADASGAYSDPSGDGRSTRNVSTATAATNPCTRGFVGSPAGYRKIMTSSTANSESTELLITDIFGNPRAINFSAAGTRGTFFSFIVRANADVSNLTFSANSDNLGRLVAIPATAATTTPAPGCPSLPAEPEKDEVFNITISDGKIIKGGATKLASGTTTDSIVFMMKLGNDPVGRNYRVSGYKYTGFPEDDH